MLSIKDGLQARMIREILACIVLAAVVGQASAYQCVFCLPGKYKSAIANNACLSCPVHHYLDYSGADDQSDCLFCGANMQSPSGSSAKTDCKCNPGFYGPPGGPCVQCPKKTYADNIGQSACTACPSLFADSNIQSDRITNCSCVAGYTGPDGGACAQCALHTYKTAIGPQACTACDQNTMTLEQGKTSKTACICTPGHTVSGGGGTALSSSVCLRFLSLWSIPSFGTIAAKQSSVTVSPTPPVYFATGGPGGGGYVHFQDELYFRKDQVSVSPKTNGGVTLAIVMRLTSSLSSDRGTVFGLNLDGCWLRVWVTPAEGKISAATGDDFGEFAVVDATATDVTQWMRITVTYNTVSLVLSVTINDAVPVTANGFPGMMNDGSLVNGVAVSIFTGGTTSSWLPGFDGDVAGIFFVDELIMNSAITVIQSKMMSGMDLTPLCESSGDIVCGACSAGKYKVAPGPAACTNCGVHTFSTAVAATAAATCESCPSNTVSVIGSGIITACTCNTGYTGADGNACGACEAGQWKDAIGSADCTDCGLGTYSGLSAAKTASTCSICPDNSYTKLAGNDVLEDCECNAGYTGPNGGHCTACPAGKYKLTPGSHECTSCLADTYSTVVGSTTGATCLTCPASSQSPVGSSAKAACVCNMGYTGPGGLHGAGVTACVACIAGTFKDAIGPATCTNCAVQKYSTAVAATSVVTCESCSANMLADAGSDAATDCKCAKGYTGLDGTTCEACIAGTYKTSVGDATCVNCAADKYSTVVAKTDSVCESCLASSQSIAGSDEQTDCKCNAGYSGLDGGSCVACPKGSFKIAASYTPESSTCSVCQVNTYQPLTAQTLASACQSCAGNSQSPAGSDERIDCQCNAGYWGPNGAVTCLECYAGQYKPEKGPQDCSVCPNATYSGLFAQTAITTCVACPSMSLSFAGSDALSDCHCDAGYYTEDMGLPSKSCVACAQGTYNEILGVEACSKCTAGKYSTDLHSTSRETCLTCESGWSLEGRFQCEPCPGNSKSVAGSRTVQTDCKCDPGYSGADGGTCMFCLPGKFKEESGAAACSDCPISTFSPDTAREFESDCLDCPDFSQSVEGSDALEDCKCSVGYTSTVVNTDGASCAECSAGKFKDVLGHAACSLCRINTYVDTTKSTSAANCIPCFTHSQSDAGSDALEDCLCVGGFERAA